MDFQSVFTIVLIILGISAVYAVTGVSLLTLISDFWGFLMRKLSKKSAKNYEANLSRFSVMSKKQKRESFRYRVYSFINEILLDLGWKNKRITVEGFNMFLLLSTTIIGLAMYIFLRSVFLTVLFSLVVWVLLYAITFLVSRISHVSRKSALMDAEDFLCGSMSQGIVMAVEDNINMIDKSIQPVFKEFISSIYDRNMDVFTALENLNIACGEQFDDFCEKCKAFERERRPGMEDTFQYNIARNAFVRELDRECNKTFAAMNRNYLASLAIIICFIVYNMLAYGSIRDFYLSGFGKLLLTFYFSVSSIAFIIIQYIQSKPFKYGKK